MIILYPKHRGKLIKWHCYYKPALLFFQPLFFPLTTLILPPTPSLLKIFSRFGISTLPKGVIYLIRRISGMCAKNIIALGKLHDTNESVLQYGCELILSTIIGLLLLMGISLLISHPMAWLFFILGFAIHRTSAGGYHADTHTLCFLVTSAMFLIGAMASIKLEWHNFSYLVIAVFSAVLVLCMAPLEAQNKPLSKKRFKNNRRNSLLVISINFIIAAFFTVMNIVTKEANLYFAGIFFATFSLIMGKIKNYLKGGSRHER